MTNETPQKDEIDERERFCDDLAPHLADAMEALGIEDVDTSDGQMLADTIYCLGYRLNRSVQRGEEADRG